MIFQDLIIVHHKKFGKSHQQVTGASHGYEAHHLLSPPAEVPAGAFVLDSCQRTMWVFYREPFAPRLRTPHMDGRRAYEFLLRVTTGLESQMKGEAEVFGQVKMAWAQYGQNNEVSGGAVDSVRFQKPRLQQLFQKLFEDAKFIRSEFLQNLGHLTYGAILKEIIIKHTSELASQQKKLKVLMVGAGSFSESLLPWLQDCAVTVTNRTSEKAQVLCDKWPGMQTLDWNEAASVAGITAHQWDAIVFCVPGSEAVQEKWLSALRLVASGVHDASQGAEQMTALPLLVDLGEPAVLSESFCHFSNLNYTTVSLDDFYLRQGEARRWRDHSITLAESACAERALHRELNNTVTFPHGWDDLMAV